MVRAQSTDLDTCRRCRPVYLGNLHHLGRRAQQVWVRNKRTDYPMATDPDNGKQRDAAEPDKWHSGRTDYVDHMG